ncbi:MAG: hypothetical protein ACTSP4_13045 [Candidatus Hodarchaeales archaeon]
MNEMKTEETMLFFDLEHYVPEEQRQSKTTTLRANPDRKGQFLLGGVVTNLQYDDGLGRSNTGEYWIWKETSLENDEEIQKAEEKVLEKIYHHFKRSWEIVTQNFSRRRDLIVVGTGIARFDLPLLYIRSSKYQFAPKEDLYSIFLKTKPIDLTTLGIAFVKPKGRIKPVSTRDLMRSLGIKDSKETGQIVWELYDNGEYDKIEKRTNREVKTNIIIYSELISRIRQKYQQKRVKR